MSTKLDLILVPTDFSGLSCPVLTIKPKGEPYFTGGVNHHATDHYPSRPIGIEHRYIEEVGAMNIFFVLDDELITPELSGSILPGITRDTVLQFAKMWGLKATERKISIEELMDAGLQENFSKSLDPVRPPSFLR
jgi:hypothetical protein